MFDLLWGRGQKTFKTSDTFQYLFGSFACLGTNPPKRLRLLYFVYSAIVNVNCAVAPITFSMGYVMYAQEMSMEQIYTLVQTGVNAVGIPIKVIAVTLSLNRLRSFNVVAEKLDVRYTTPGQRAKIRQCVMMGSRTVVYFAIAYGLYPTMLYISAISQRRVLYSLYVPFWDWRSSTMDYWLQVSYEMTLCHYLISQQVVNDCYPVVYIYAIRTHLQLLTDRVKCLTTDQNKSKDDNYADLVQCIKDHQLVLQLQDIVSPVISITIFVQFTITAALLGTTMINILFADGSSQLNNVLYLMAVVVQTSPTCYQATYLMEDSDQLPLAIFHSNWMEQDIRYRKMLILFMQKAQESMTLAAMKFFNINLNTNLAIGKFSFSLYTLIKEMDIGAKYKN